MDIELLVLRLHGKDAPSDPKTGDKECDRNRGGADGLSIHVIFCLVMRRMRRRLDMERVEVGVGSSARSEFGLRFRDQILKPRNVVVRPVDVCGKFEVLEPVVPMRSGDVSVEVEADDPNPDEVELLSA